MAGNFSRDIGREGLRARFDIAHAYINRNQFGSDIHDKNVHEVAAAISRTTFRRADQFAPDSLLLVRGVHGEQSEVGAIAAKFEVNAPKKLGGGFREEECSGLKHRVDLIGAGAVAINEEEFDSKSEVDQGQNLRDVGRAGRADRHVRHDSPRKARYTA